MGFLFEPIQGEGGVVVPLEGYLRRVREICSRHNVLMMADEIQSGRVRRAFAMATDREALADVVIQGHVSPATGGFLPPGMPGHSPEIGLPYDPEQARRLLAEAGYPEGRGFPPISTRAFGAVRSQAEYLESQWRDVLGVETRWEILPWAAFLTTLEGNPPQIVNLMWAADYSDPDNFLRFCP